MAVAWLPTEGLAHSSMTVQQQVSLVGIIQTAQESEVWTLWLSDSRNTHHGLCINTRKTGGSRSERARHAANEDRLGLTT